MIQADKTIFVGREEELTQLIALAKDAFSRNTGVVFVTGEAGIGKTFLIEEFFRRLQLEYEDVVIASGQCSVQSASYLPFHAILEHLLESQKKVHVSGKKLRQVAEVVVSTIWDVGPDLIGVFGVPIKTLQTIIDKLGLRGKKSVPERDVPKDLDQIKIFGWYTKVMKDISAQFPLVLFMDDLHWADDSSLNLLLHLGRELEEQRILVIGSYRPYEVPPNSLLRQVKNTLGRYGAKELSLDVSEENPEDAKKAKQFVHEYLLTKYRTNFSEQFEQLLTERTEGNALFLTEILQNFEEKGQIELVSDKRRVLFVASIERLEDLPEKVENAISERVERLETTLRGILDYASVEGDDFIAQVIAQVRQIQERTLINDLTKKLIKTYQLIIERGGKSLPNGNRIHEFSFKHNLIREYLYEQLSKTDRELIHAEIGECLEKVYEPNADVIASKLAIHFYHAHVLEKAGHYCLKAAQDANKKYGVSETVRFCHMGLESLERQTNILSQEEYAEKKMQLLLELAKAEKLGGNQQEKKDHIQAGISYLENHTSLFHAIPEELRAEIYAQLGELYNRKHSKQEAKEYFEKALCMYQNLDNKKEFAEILWLLSDIYLFIPDSTKEQSPEEIGIQTLKESLSVATQLQDSELRSRCLSSMTWKYTSTDMIYAQKCALQALELSRSLHGQSTDAEIRALSALGMAYRKAKKYKTGLQYAEEALALSQKRGDTVSVAWILHGLGMGYRYYIRSQKQAQEAFEESIFIRKRLGLETNLTFSHLGLAFAMQGKWKKAEECLQEANIIETTELDTASIRDKFGQLYLLQGHYPQAEEEFLHRIEILKQYQDSSSLPTCAKTALNYALLGSTGKCKAYLKQCNLLLERKQDSQDTWEGLYEIAEIQRILGGLRLAKMTCQNFIESFLTHAEDAEELVSLAEAHLVMGKILMDMGDYQEAIPYLNKAKDAFDICKHYALGETLLYLGKAHKGLGGTVFINQAQEYISNAILEFQRLELHHKEHEAEDFLNTLF